MPNNQRGLAISLIPLALRRISGPRTVASGAVQRTMSQQEFADTLRRYQQQAAAPPLSLPKLVVGLWKSEGFSTSFGKYRLPENTLNDPKIPRESLGISHVGYGSESTQYARFSPAKLHEIVETKANPNYKGFLYEGIGAILRMYEPGLLRRLCVMSDLIPKDAAPAPDKSGFYAQFMSAFDDEQQRLITHGYGRLISFSSIKVFKAIDEARTLPPKLVYPAVQGIAFAFAMMNSPDMPRLLANSAIDYPPEIRAAFQDGLVYGLVFSEWFVPGFLATWRATDPLEEKLVERARAESAGNLKRGSILPFALERSIAAAAI